ncbi:VOC family protein [Barrientosiimonas humi]|uniref:VOC family protein n=1 Tax=Barrientosiimonas humi TaxID=999931 RepID=UPI00370DBADE
MRPSRPAGATSGPASPHAPFPHRRRPHRPPRRLLRRRGRVLGRGARRCAALERGPRRGAVRVAGPVARRGDAGAAAHGSRHSPRVHLDIETDDVEAEVARVTALGATVHERREGYVILADPGGLLFCVVPVQTGDAFAQQATTWE